MKRNFIILLCIIFAVNLSQAQAWMTSLDIAQKLALVQNKMVLMVWEETTNYQYPVLVRDDRGRTHFIENLFEDENLSPLIWKNFVPVIVSEDKYADLFYEIKDKRSRMYIDKFNDDSIKIMDINGNILNVNGLFEEVPNITTLIKSYALNTEYVAPELIGYYKEKTYYTAYFLASKYLDFTLYSDKKIRSEIIKLSNIYLDEAITLIEETDVADKLVLKQRADLLKIQEYLVLKRPKKVIRQLKKIEASKIENNNKALVSFLYYTAYSCIGDEKKVEVWKSKVSSVNLRKAQMIINLNS